MHIVIVSVKTLQMDGKLICKSNIYKKFNLSVNNLVFLHFDDMARQPEVSR